MSNERIMSMRQLSFLSACILLALAFSCLFASLAYADVASEVASSDTASTETVIGTAEVPASTNAPASTNVSASTNASASAKAPTSTNESTTAKHPVSKPSKAGWLKDTDGSWYYFTSATANPSTGWIKLKKTWYYLDPAENGKMKTGLFNDGKANYIASASGAMQANKWVKLGTDWYYATKSGALKTGWLKSGGKWYWLQADKQGLMASNQWITDQNKRYYLSASGAMKTGWVKDGTDWYYTNKSGASQTGWVKSNKKWYWLIPEDGGKMAQNQWIEDKGKRYYLTNKGPGQMATGWIPIGNGWYYADASGAQKREGWVFSGGRWYYLQGDKQGLMFAGGFKDINKAKYSFESSGAMRFDTLIDLADGKVGYASPSGDITTIGVRKNGKVILQNEAGEALTGWQKIGKFWFYGDEGGVAHTGWLELDGKTYWLNDSGVKTTNARVINGERYYFDESGVRGSNCTQAYRTTLQKARNELARCTTSNMSKDQKLRAAYNHVRNDSKSTLPRIPHMKALGWETTYANDIFDKASGNCFSYAAAFAFMAKALGYNNIYVLHNGTHGWVEIDSLFYDPHADMATKTNLYGYSNGTAPTGASWMRIAI